MPDDSLPKTCGPEFLAASKITKIGSTPFPMHVARPDGTFATTKKDILHSIGQFYSEIANNADKAAQEHIKAARPWPNPEPKSNMSINSDYRKSWREEESRQQEPDSPNDANLSDKEIENAIGKINVNGAPGEDNITPVAVTLAKTILLPYFRILFNSMWQRGYTPIKWQRAFTKLLHKKGSTSHIENYRPITLLSTLFK